MSAGAVKVEDLPGYWADKLNVPTSLIRDETEREEFAAKVAEEVAEVNRENGR